MHVKSMYITLPEIVSSSKLCLVAMATILPKKCKSVSEEFGCLQFIADSLETFGNVQKAHTCTV